jgi:protoporphyrinogen/coproporphyrinogen III oxidase
LIIIAGGGISGLSAAFELTRRGVRFCLLEASDRVGGLIRTEQHGGFTIDAGADSMLANKPPARVLCEEAGLTPRLQPMRARHAFVLSGDRLYPLPSPSVLGLPLTLRAAAGFELLPVAARFRVLLEPFLPAGPEEDESIASFFTRRFGAAAAALVGQPLLGGIHAGDTTRLSVRSLFPNLVEAERRGSVLRALGRTQPQAGGAFLSLSGGMETLPRALADGIPPGAIRLGAGVGAIRRVEDGWRVETSIGTQRADAVILATPVHATARLLAEVDADAARLLADIPHASTVSVVLAWRRDAIAHPLAGSGFVVARGNVRVTACTWISSKWDGRAPAGHALLRAFIGGVHDPAAIGLADDELTPIAVRDLTRILGIRAAPEWSRVFRWPDASPQLNLGHDERVAQAARQLDRQPGIFVTGRGYRAVGIPDCIADARRAAAAAADYLSHRTGEEHVHENAG